MLRVMARRVPPTALVLLTVTGVLLLALVSAGGSSAVQIGPGFVPEIGSLPQPEPTEEGEEQDDVPVLISVVAAAGFGILLMVLISLLLFGLILFIGAVRFRTRRGRRRGNIGMQFDEPDSSEELPPSAGNWVRQAARAALDELRQRTGGEPGDAVVAAWLVLERAAARAGSGRKAHQTPTEFTTAVLAEHRVDAAALDRLRTLYQRARFGTRGSVTGEDVADAEEALRRVVDELVGSAP